MVNYFRSTNVFIAEFLVGQIYEGIIITIEENVKTIQHRYSKTHLREHYLHVFNETTKEVFEDAFLDAGDNIVRCSDAIQFITNA